MQRTLDGPRSRLVPALIAVMTLIGGPACQNSSEGVDDATVTVREPGGAILGETTPADQDAPQPSGEDATAAP